MYHQKGLIPGLSFHDPLARVSRLFLWSFCLCVGIHLPMSLKYCKLHKLTSSLVSFFGRFYQLFHIGKVIMFFVNKENFTFSVIFLF